jgi:hypothetical protein
MKRLAIVLSGFVAVASAASAQTPPERQTLMSRAGLLSAFFGAVADLQIVFIEIGSLGGEIDRGQVWIASLSSGEQKRIVESDDLSWPVMAPDGHSVFALRQSQLVKLGLDDGSQTAIGGDVKWRKLLGVQPNGTVLGFVSGVPRANAALMTPDGDLQLFPQPSANTDQQHQSLLLQENRAYSGKRVLRVLPSARGGLGRDVFFETDGKQRPVSDCGYELCGQPSLSTDGMSVLYVRSAPH